jgi:hypothetical protein
MAELISNMTERVMAAMWAANKVDGNVFASPTQQSDLDVIARAAIAAMFEPTSKMVMAAENASGSNLWVCPTVGWECATIMYKAMIREAMRHG